jgi:hypothetical protein
MKASLAIIVLLASTVLWAADTPPPSAPAPSTVAGEVLEVKEVEAYTYLRLKTKEGETWAAVAKSPVKKGATVTIENVMVMSNFESKSLKKTFKTILFGSLAGAGVSATGGKDLTSAHSGAAKPIDVPDTKVPKATGANAQTVADVMTKSAELKGKAVLVRGKVVKYNPGIMGKNWIHLRDGTGSPANGSNDVLVTTMSTAKVGDIVTIKGTVRTDKDFGSGYAYKVLIEEATLQP